ncbi:MAG: hypothetical protein NT099_00495 [Candidatus Saganbacteria bacterium]|nr:hypothetical protein [Candidatus Saganbacteria bacterium]
MSNPFDTDPIKSPPSPLDLAGIYKFFDTAEKGVKKVMGLLASLEGELPADKVRLVIAETTKYLAQITKQMSEVKQQVQQKLALLQKMLEDLKTQISALKDPSGITNLADMAKAAQDLLATLNDSQANPLYVKSDKILAKADKLETEINKVKAGIEAAS